MMYERGLPVTPARREKRCGSRWSSPISIGRGGISHRTSNPGGQTQSLLGRRGERGVFGYIRISDLQCVSSVYGNLPFKLLVRNLIDLLLPEPLLRKIAAPSGTGGR